MAPLRQYAWFGLLYLVFPYLLGYFLLPLALEYVGDIAPGQVVAKEYRNVRVRFEAGGSVHEVSVEADDSYGIGRPVTVYYLPRWPRWAHILTPVEQIRNRRSELLWRLVLYSIGYWIWRKIKSQRDSAPAQDALSYLGASPFRVVSALLVAAVLGAVLLVGAMMPVVWPLT